jgi:Uncharacterized protein conserved in bacteria
MKYLCLVYAVESEINAMSPSEMNVQIDKALAYDEELRRTGHFIAAEALEPVKTATTLRMRTGKLSMTDGPFAETKEQLAGFYLIEAKDLNEALQIAGKIPCAYLGSIEVRPICDLETFKS